MMSSVAQIIVTALKVFICAFTGMSAGALVSAGVFAYITMVGIIPRLAAKTKTAAYVRIYENGIIWGGTVANVIYIFNIGYRMHGVMLAVTSFILYVVYGICAGIFVGCLAIALAEVLKSFPIFAMRIRLTWGIPYITLSLAVGKMIGSFYGLMKSR